MIPKPWVHPMTGLSKIKTERWACFLGDIQNESVRFRDVMSQAQSNHEKADSDFKKYAQMTFNSLHKVKRTRRTEVDDGVFRPRQRIQQPVQQQEVDRERRYELFRQPSPVKVRPQGLRRLAGSAARVWAPRHLREVYNLRPKQKDVFVISGEKVEPAPFDM
jgi:hypothetical protein